MTTTVNLGIKQSEKLAYIAQLSHNEKWEVFFRPRWGETKPSYFYDGPNNTEQNIRNIDHISFHEDGDILFRIKDAAGYQDKIQDKKLEHTITTMPKDCYGALLIYSVYDFSLVNEYFSKPSHLTFNDSQNVDMLIEVQEIENQFSLALFLLGENVDTKAMLLSHFSPAFIPGNSICIHDFLVDRNNPSHYLQLLVAYTNKVIHPPHPSALDGSQKFKQADRTENAIGIMIACSDDDIRQMV